MSYMTKAEWDSIESGNELASHIRSTSISLDRRPVVEVIPYISRTETNVKAIASRRSIAPGAYLLDFCSNRQNVNRTREFYLTNVRRRANGPVVSTFVAPTKGHKANFKAIQVLKARSMEDVLQESMMLFDFEPATV